MFAERALVLVALGASALQVMSASSMRPKIYEIHGPEFVLSLDKAQNLHEQAEDLYYDGKYIEAFQQLDAALTLTRDAVGTDHRDVVNILATISDGYLVTGNPARAHQNLKEALRIGEKSLGGQHPVIARCLRNMAGVHLTQGDFAAANAAINRCLAIQKEHYGTNHVAYALSLNIKSLLFVMEGKTAEADRMVRQASTVIQGVLGTNTVQFAMCLFIRSVIAHNRADFDEAIRLAQESRSIFERIVGPGHIVLTLANNQLAAAYQQIGRYQEAVPLLRTNLQNLEETLGTDNLQVCMALDSLGLAHYRLGDFVEAERLFRRCLALREKYATTNSPGYAATANNLALALMEAGKTAEVFQLYAHSAKVLEKAFGNENPELATVLCNWGVFAENAGQLEIAHRLYWNSLVIRNKVYGHDHPAVADTIDFLAALELKRDKVDFASELALESLRIREMFYSTNHPAVAASLYTLARLRARQSNYTAAIELFSESAGIRARTLGPENPSVAQALENAALACHAMGETAAAIKILSSTLGLQRGRLVAQLARGSSRDALQLIEDSSYRGEMLQSLCGLASSDSLSGAEQAALNKSIWEELQAIQAIFEADPRTETKELRAQSQAIQSRLERLRQQDADSVELDLERRKLQRELSKVENSLADWHGFVAQHIREQSLTISEVSKCVPQNRALLDLVHYQRYDFESKSNRWKEPRYVAYITFPSANDSTNITVERVDLGDAKPIDDAVEVICRRLNKVEFRTKDFSNALQRLGKLVYLPVARYLTNVTHLIVCPDGQLSRVPFEMLPVGEKFLVEEKTITYVSSGREIVRLARAIEKPKTNAPVVMGNPDFDWEPRRPASGSGGLSLLTSAAARSLSRHYRGIRFDTLPGAEEEAKTVARLLGDDCVLLLGKQAREADLKKVVSPRVLHLATHGFFLTDQEFKRTNAATDIVLPVGNFSPGRLREGDWENPMLRCGIALAGANHASRITNSAGEDGLLTGLEAALLNLQGTELVILSACDSGSGEVKIGEGVMSLRRAFRIAGAEAVLASHWSVNDKATSRLMTEFIRRWRAGEPRAKAWREAQLSLLRSKGTKEDFSNPYFWSAFTLTGQWR